MTATGAQLPTPHAAIDEFYRLAAGPVVYGRNDCGVTAGTLLARANRGDPLRRWRGRYTTMRGFLRVVKREGLATLEDAVARSAADMDWPEIDPAGADDFDLGLARLDTAAGALAAPGVVWRGFLLVRADTGALHLPMTMAKRTWRTCPS